MKITFRMFNGYFGMFMFMELHVFVDVRWIDRRQMLNIRRMKTTLVWLIYKDEVEGEDERDEGKDEEMEEDETSRDRDEEDKV